MQSGEIFDLPGFFLWGLFFPLLFLFFHFENNYEGPSINSFILCRIPEIMARKIFHMRVFLARNCAKMNVFLITPI